METKCEIGKRIRELRKFYNMTRKTLAEKLGITISYLGLIERGQRGTSVKRYKEICILFHVSLDYLLAGNEDPQAQSKFNPMNVCKSNLNKNEIRYLTDLVKALSLSKHTDDEVDSLFQALYRQWELLK